MKLWLPDAVRDSDLIIGRERVLKVSQEAQQ
jgi:hypothetical protein